MSLISQFQAGGFFMYFILAFAILTIALIIERTYALYVNYKKPTKGFRETLLKHLSKGEWSEARTYTQQLSKDSGLSRIAHIGLELREEGGAEEEIQARMDEELTGEITKIDKRTGFLAMFGNVATLLGLLGTVTGLISSFAGVSSASPLERATLLGQGIAEALNSTAFGLVAAIPALVAFAVFQNKTDALINELTEETSKIYHDLLFLTESKRMSAEENRNRKKFSGSPSPALDA